MRLMTHRDGALRVYDATATPYYIQLLFVDAGFSGPIARGRPEEVEVLNRGRYDANALPATQSWHYIEGPDTPISTPLTLQFSFKLVNVAGDPNYQKFRQALNLDMSSTWKVGANTWVTTKGTTQVLSGGVTPTSTTTPTFADGRKRTVNVEVLWTDPDSTGNMGWKWAEVYFPPDQQSLNEGADGVDIRCSGRVYGNVQPIVAFTTGNAG